MTWAGHLFEIHVASPMDQQSLGGNMKRTCLVVLSVLALVACGAKGSDSASPKAPVTTEVTTTTEAPTTTSTTIPPAEVKAAITKEAKRACDDAVFYDKEPEVTYRNYGSQWELYTTEAALEARVKRCADDGKAAKERKRIADEQAKAAAERSAIDNAGPVNVDEVVKNPDAVKGQVFALFAEITQFDGATGTCAFRALWDGRRHEYNFEYAGDNAIFTSGDGESTCPILNGIDQNDVVKLVVRGAGTYSYETQVGGNTTVPSFDVLKAEVIEKK